QSISNFVYNHVSHFATSGEALSKSLFLGGVPRRFPRLKFAFMEGGVGWAASLLNDLIGHYEKRNLWALEHIDPASLDRAMLRDLLLRYGHDQVAGHVRSGDLGLELFDSREPDVVDEFAASGATSAEDIAAQFSRNFWFGAEADDHMTPLAFGVTGQQLNA